MPRSGIQKQQCGCGSKERTPIAISISASTLGTTPRRKSKNITLYLCSRDAGMQIRRAAWRPILRAVIASAEKANRRPHRAKPRAAKMSKSSGAHRRPSPSGSPRKRPSQSKLRRKMQ